MTVKETAASVMRMIQNSTSTFPSRGKSRLRTAVKMMMNRIGLTLLSTERKGTPETAMVTISTRATRANEKYVTAQKMAVI